MKQLTDFNIKEFLENVPLYVWREFEKPANLGNLRISEIDAFCEKCDQSRPFQDFRPTGGGPGPGTGSYSFGRAIQGLQTGTSHLEFTCVSCKKSMREYHVEQIVDGETIRFQKYGELPKKQLERNPVLQRFLEDDLENYEKAVVCLSHEYGVAAFAYFRRIVENNINKLLDLVQEDAQSSSANTKLIELDKLRENSPMGDKIKIANHALPEYLNPSGQNPLGRLYKVLSEGVHEFSEEECLDKARATSECLAYLVGELTSRKKHRDRFKSMIGEL